MTTLCFREGEEISLGTLSELSLELDISRDFLESSDSVRNSGKGSLCFTGVVSNHLGNKLIILPKNYRFSSPLTDARLLLACIFKHKQNNPTLYHGPLADDIYKSNFPFAAFFDIYDYYSRFGLYVEKAQYYSPKHSNKLSWRHTISRSPKYVSNGKLVMYPLYYRHYNYENVFVTRAMVHAINYTIEIFPECINIPKIETELHPLDLTHASQIVSELMNIKQKVYNERLSRLLDSLIDFYQLLPLGGSFYLKFYCFQNIWEEAVRKYLNCFFYGISNSSSILLAQQPHCTHTFTKPEFHVNEAKPSQFIQPDYFFEDERSIMIFDAKYYTKIDGLDYKQMVYSFILGCKNNPRKRLFIALILPSQIRETLIHYSPSAQFVPCCSFKFQIMEEYFEIHKVLETYLAS